MLLKLGVGKYIATEHIESIRWDHPDWWVLSFSSGATMNVSIEQERIALENWIIQQSQVAPQSPYRKDAFEHDSPIPPVS